MSVPPPARGARRDWSELPRHLVAALEDALGSPIVTASTQPGGFSPGIAARVVCEDRRRAFVKAVASVPNPRSPDFHRREARIVGGLPDAAPVPRLVWFHDEGPDGWVVLALEDVDGHEPAQPWRADELDREDTDSNPDQDGDSGPDGNPGNIDPTGDRDPDRHNRAHRDASHASANRNGHGGTDGDATTDR